MDMVNRVSLTSQCRGISPEVVLRELVDEAIIAHSRVLASLEPHAAALTAYQLFSQGYIGFHAGLDRYKLHELNFHETEIK